MTTHFTIAVDGVIDTDVAHAEAVIDGLRSPVETPDERAAIIRHLADQGVVPPADGSADFADPIGGSDVVVLRSPLIPHDQFDPYVGYTDDWGMVKGLPVNMKAWALYGRSPIYGPMVVKTDLTSEIPAAVIDMVTKPLDKWVPREVLRNMHRILSEVNG